MNDRARRILVIATVVLFVTSALALLGPLSHAVPAVPPVIINPDARFVLRNSNMAFQFTVDPMPSRITVTKTTLTLDALGVGGYVQGAVQNVWLNVSTWETGTPVYNETVFEATASVTGVTSVNVTFNATSSWQLVFYVDGSAQPTQHIGTKSTSFWPLWATAHTVEWRAIQTAPTFILGGVDIIGGMEIFAFIFILIFVLVGGWWLKEQRGD